MPPTGKDGAGMGNMKGKASKARKHKKTETSKKILLASHASAIALTAIVIAGSFMGHDTSDITTIASLA